ncbi:MAG: DUF4197 domain-containing protein [Flavobacterium sp.]|uniref:DUF4197 domain-containing protein n=1 Tax=Flavobacterium sp. TaxID=239 RepID=UPI0012142A15|nr:DUF4197 domain-containing protein [Flavobacterium sp.]RZJ67497.1 MAG: DUF4197 domain-containing protein [Flavobacterium sp.]
MRKLVALALFLPFISNAQIDGLINKAKDAVSGKSASTSTSTSGFGNLDIASALKEALDKGIDKQVTKLTATDGFYKNASVKILFPEELQKVDKALRKVGLGSLADEGIKSLNRAAEDAVKESTPIFVNAVKQMSFTDAKTILMGSNNAATTYLQKTTNKPLYDKFSPVVASSIGKVGADKVWATIIKKYNSLPLVQKVNPDINDYVTTKALEGVYKMIAVEEKDIRTNLGSRTSNLLQQVFALQDKK